MEKLINAGIDYLTITYPFQYNSYPNDNNKIFELNFLIVTLELILKLDSKKSDHKFNKNSVQYNHKIQYDDGIFIKYGGVGTSKDVIIASDEYNEAITKNYESLCLDISGSGCRICDSKNIDFKEIMDTRNHYYGKCSRIDLFIDFINYGISIPDLYLKFKNNEFVSCFKKMNYQGFYNISSENIFIDGEALTFGSRNSNVELQIYNKKLERENNSFNVEVQDWVRFELRFRHDKAEPACKEFLDVMNSKDNIIDYVSKLILGCLELKVPGNDSNKSRWEINPLWKNLFGNNKEKIQINQNTLENRLMKKVEWLENSAFKNYTLTRILTKLTNDNFFFDHLFLKGLEKFKMSDLNKLNHEFKRRGLNIELSSDDITYLLLQYQNKLEKHEIFNIEEEIFALKLKNNIQDSDLPF